MSLTRRHFLQRAAAVSFGFGGLQAGLAQGSVARRLLSLDDVGYGPLRLDPDGVFDLPRGFHYTIISRHGEEMQDGLLVPGGHDGMAAFPGPDGMTLIVRNHELSAGSGEYSPFEAGGARATRIDPTRVYDAGHGAPIPGGTTTLLYDTRERRLVRHWLSLAGTERNCAGGPTPWGSWVSCEETVSVRDSAREQDHGWCFEVPATAERGLAEPRPIKAMGRFNHEAIAVDPASGIVYLTEDRGDGLLYRFIPEVGSDLHAGGKLQALAVTGKPGLDTRNWNGAAIAERETFAAEWIDLDGIEAPRDDLRFRGHEAGAARFARGEGMWWGRGAVYWACTNGGRAKAGQIWRLTPGEDERPDRLELFIEPNDRSVLENADNITFSPRGDIIVCEDGRAEQFLVGITPAGELYKLARNAMNGSELAGACFSPDGSTLFVNIQWPGLTLAITGPWRG